LDVTWEIVDCEATQALSDVYLGLGFESANGDRQQRPRSRKLRVLLNFIRASRGRITYGELSRRLDARQVKNTSISYMGFATKTEGNRG
jgi:2-polyprenyl-6-hydroxyphenyl methylase/3-demethylubiquinone-9 3-methyltransferase